MGVFPAASGNFLPETWRNLMTSPVSMESRITCQEFIFLHVSHSQCFSWYRILPSSTSTQTTLPSILTARSTRGRVSCFPHLWSNLHQLSSFTSIWWSTKLQCSQDFTLVFLFIFKGVALLPFVDECRLRAALDDVYPNLTPEEGGRSQHSSKLCICCCFSAKFITFLPIKCNFNNCHRTFVIQVGLNWWH